MRFGHHGRGDPGFRPEATGCSGAGLILNGLARKADIQLRLMQVSENTIGVLVENSAKGALLGLGGIEFTQGGVGNNSMVDIQLVNSDGMRITKTTLGTPQTGSGAVGIELDATSDANLIKLNTWYDPMMLNTAYIDNGTGNCAEHNSFPTPACP